MDDPVELLLSMHQPRRRDPRVDLASSPPQREMDEMYASLSPAEARRLADAVFERPDLDESARESIASCLAAFTNASLDELLKRFLDRGEVPDAIAFRGAGVGVRDRLGRLLDAREMNANLALASLAFIGDESVVAWFDGWRRSPPAWRADLFVDPANFTRTAGWELLDGRRRELTFDACVGLHAAEAGVASTVRVHGPREDACPWCGGALVNLVELDLTAPVLRAFASSIGDRVEVATCPVCTCFGEVHATLDASGRGAWSAANARPSYLPPDGGGGWARSAWADGGVRLARRGRLHGADEFLPTTFSQIGGLPGWVQDPAYPTCLACARTMTFLAQIDEAAFPSSEGIYYAFVCAACRTTATTYQQT